DVLDNPIINLTVRGRRRTTLPVGLAFDTDLAKARELLLDVVGTVDGVHAHPPPEAWVEEFGDSSINVAVRFWHAPDGPTMWRVRSDGAVAVKQALGDAGIDMPFPQRVVRLPQPRPPVDDKPIRMFDRGFGGVTVGRPLPHLT